MPTSDIATFRADDSIVEIIPDFDLSTPLNLSSTVPVGPFKAGIAAKVPLWMAVVLEQRSLATISPPAWLSMESLTAIIAYERREPNLYHDETKLPRNYYELSKRIKTNDAIALLIQDLLDIRVDKLRQQFQSILYDRTMNNSGEDVIFLVNGIGTQEIAMLRDFIVQALADKSFLEHVEEPTETASTARTSDKPEPQAIRRSKAPLRKFRAAKK